MSLTPEQISENWNTLLSTIDQYISSPRKEKLTDFYNKYEERLTLMPAAHKKEYHNAFPGGYIDHVNRVVAASLKLHNVWVEMGVDDSTYTIEELVFSAINHDLGKMGDQDHECYIPQTDQWRKDKLGEDYTFNKQVPFASVPDRGLFLLQAHDIKYSFNEMIAIQTHDGLYDDGNKKYLFTYLPEQKPRTSLLYIIHQADLMAARIEFEKEWLSNLKNPQPKKDNFKLKTNKTTKKQSSPKNEALGTVNNGEGLKNLLANL